MNENSNPMEEIEKEIEETKRKAGGDDFEIEIAEEVKQVEAQDDQEEKPDLKVKRNLSEKELSDTVQTRINKITEQRRLAEIQAKKYQEETAQLKARLERLEKNNVQQQTTHAQNEFQKRYDLTKQALTKAVEEGDTEAQVSFSEQMADMRAAIRVNDLQTQMQAQQSVSPTVGRAQQASVNPAPPRAMSWWNQNQWFNAKGYERETAAARAIDVQLDLEGYDKNSEDYYNLLNSRLQRVFPELVSSNDQSTKSKSRKTVAPTTGGSTYRGNRVRMTQDQLRMARELGINDEAGLKKYASEIQKSQRS